MTRWREPQQHCTLLSVAQATDAALVSTGTMGCKMKTMKDCTRVSVALACDAPVVANLQGGRTGTTLHAFVRVSSCQRRCSVSEGCDLLNVHRNGTGEFYSRNTLESGKKSYVDRELSLFL